MLLIAANKLSKKNISSDRMIYNKSQLYHFFYSLIFLISLRILLPHSFVQIAILWQESYVSVLHFISILIHKCHTILPETVLPEIVSGEIVSGEIVSPEIISGETRLMQSVLIPYDKEMINSLVAEIIATTERPDILNIKNFSPDPVVAQTLKELMNHQDINLFYNKGVLKTQTGDIVSEIMSEYLSRMSKSNLGHITTRPEPVEMSSWYSVVKIINLLAASLTLNGEFMLNFSFVNQHIAIIPGIGIRDMWGNPTPSIGLSIQMPPQQGFYKNLQAGMEVSLSPYMNNRPIGRPLTFEIPYFGSKDVPIKVNNIIFDYDEMKKIYKPRGDMDEIIKNILNKTKK